MLKSGKSKFLLYLKNGFNGKKTALILVLTISVTLLFIFNVFAQTVHNRTRTIDYFNITNALQQAVSGELIEVDAGIYEESLYFPVTGVTLRATDWRVSGDNTSTIVFSTNREYVVALTNTTNIVIQGFTFKSCTNYGVYFTNAFNVEIRNCNIISNKDRGIRFEYLAGCSNILLYSNFIAHNEAAGMHIGAGGIKLAVIANNFICSNGTDGVLCKADNCFYTNNRIYDNDNKGIEDRGNKNEWVNNIIYNNANNYDGMYFLEAENCIVSGNKVYNNGKGIYLHKSMDTVITNNTIYSNKDGAGIRISVEDNNNIVIVNNEIYESESGIRIVGNTGINVRRNNIYDLTGYGIRAENMNGIIELNTVKHASGAGIVIVGSTIPAFTKNNIFSNTMNLSNQTTSLVVVTNHWWGTTIASDIYAKIEGGAGGYNASNYRLFGPFDISENADTARFPAISWVQAYTNSVPLGTRLIWTKPADPAFIERYFVYRSKEPGTSNLSIANVITQVSDSSITNIVDIKASIYTQYFYHITSLDKHPVYSNESWYSGETSLPPIIPGDLTNFTKSGDYECMIISWDDYATETSYTLYRSTSIGSTNFLTSIPMNTSAYTDCTVNTNTKYYYWIRAANAYGTSGYSEVSSNTTPMIAVPDVPSWIDIYVNASGIIIGWENVTNETSYTLYISTNNFTETNEKIPFSKDETNHIYGYQDSATYSVKVKAHNIAGGSAFSPVDSLIVNFRVFNRTQGWSYTNISIAISNVTPNDLIEADPHIYNEELTLVSHMTLRATAWTQSRDNTTTVIFSTNSDYVVGIENATNIVIQGFTIENGTNFGIYCNESYNVQIRNCNIISNDTGIRFPQDALCSNILIYSNFTAHNDATGMTIGANGIKSASIVNNFIYSNKADGVLCKANNCFYTNNRVYANGQNGIEDRGDKNEWINNIIYNNANNYDAMYFLEAKNCIVSGNKVYNNNKAIYLHQSAGTVITNNTIYSNNNGADIRISVDQNNNIVIVNNEIYGSESGIRIVGNTGINVRRNNIYDLTDYGIRAEGMDGEIELNTVKHASGAGVVIAGSTIPTLKKNNIFSNTINLSNQTTSLVVVTNHWWGTTIASDIHAKIEGGTGGYNASNYRLFGEFDIAENADTDRPPPIINVWTYSNSSPFGIGLIWNKSSAADTERYFVYRSKVPGTTNLSTVDIITQFDNTVTNFVDQNIGLYTQYYYHVTALDDYPIYTNESWYSVTARGSMPVTMPELYIEKSIESVSLDGNSISIIPGCTIRYKIFCTNAGDWQADNVLLYDQISKYVVYVSNSATNTVTGWSNEWSTNSDPDQSWNSVDYTNKEPAVSNIKWIRWKNETIYTNEATGFLYFKVIIK